MSKGVPYTEENIAKFLKRLDGVEGNVTLAAESLGMHKCSVRTWMNRHPEFKKQCQEIKDKYDSSRDFRD